MTELKPGMIGDIKVTTMGERLEAGKDGRMRITHVPVRGRIVEVNTQMRWVLLEFVNPFGVSLRECFKFDDAALKNANWRTPREK